jgi:hypothetical protein
VAFFTKYQLNHFAYAVLEKVVMSYDNDNWGPANIHRVFAHESCHIFGALDEYGNCRCNETGGYLAGSNDNCVNCFPAGSSQEQCLMAGNTLRMCQASQRQIGWDPSLFPKARPVNAALLHPRNGKAYFFRGQQYLRFDFASPEHVDKVGTIGVDGWNGVWSNPDAALVHPNGKAYFFKGNQYQRFNFDSPEKVDKTGTIGVDGWKGVWSDLDAAVLHPNGKAYFFKGNQYQRFDFKAPEHVDKVGTLGVDGWSGVWSKIDAALIHPNKKAYFFRGDQYQRFDFASPEHVDKVGNLGIDGWPGL